MTTTLKATLDNEDVKKGLDEIVKDFGKVERSAEDVNKELEDQKKIAEENRQSLVRMAKHADKAIGKKGGAPQSGGVGGLGLLGKLGAAAAAIWAFKELAKQGMEAIRAMADAGDKDMQQVVTEMDTAVASSKQLIFETLKVGRGYENVSKLVTTLSDAFTGLTKGISGATVAMNRDVKLRKQVLDQIDEQIAKQKETERLQGLELKDVVALLEKNRGILESKKNEHLSQKELNDIVEKTLLLEQRRLELSKNQLTATEKIRKKQIAEGKFWGQLAEDQKHREEERIRKLVKDLNEERDKRNAIYKQQVDFEKLLEKGRKSRWDGIREELKAERAAHDRRLAMIEAEKQKRLQARQALVQKTTEGGQANQLLNQASSFQALFNRILQNRIAAAVKAAEQKGAVSDADRQKIEKALRQQTMQDFQRFRRGPAPGQTPGQFAQFQNKFQGEAKLATSQNAAAMIKSMKQQGSLSEETVKALAKATKVALDEADRTIRLEREVAKIQSLLNSAPRQRAMRGNR